MLTKHTTNAIKFFDMFSGIGGFRTGFERAGGFECVGHCEIDKYADAAYRAAHDIKESEVYYKDATEISTDTMPDIDILCGGFPCQSFSIAGKRKGFDDTRGTLFFEIARVARERHVPMLLLENVPGLLSHDGGRTFAAILGTLNELGYGVEWQVLDSSDFGVPQRRKRVYIVAYLDKRCAGQILPIRGTGGKALVTVIPGGRHSRVYSPEGASRTVTTKSDGGGLYAVKALPIKEATKRGYSEAFPGDSVSLSFAGQNLKRARVGKEIAHTLDTGGGSSHGVVTAKGRIRRLTPRECFRLQGFSDAQIDKFLSVDSETQAYKQAGNAVTANVVHALALKIKALDKAVFAPTLPIRDGSGMEARMDTENPDTAPTEANKGQINAVTAEEDTV